VTPVSAQTAPAPRPSAAKRPAVRVPLPINVESPDWIDINAISDDAISASMDALDRVQDMKIDATMAPLASLNLDFAPMIASLSGQAATFASDFARIAPIASFNLSGSPRAPWASADPADSLYRLARQSLNAGEYRRAADLFAQITRQYPTSQYRSDAAYWRAFALYRIGDTADLHEALIALDSGGASTTATTSRASARASAAVAKRATQDAAGAYTISSDVSASGAAALAKADGARVYFMNGARSSDTESAILAMRIRSALAARGDATAAAQIASTASAGGTSCDDEDAQLRVEALNALVQMDPKNAEPAITKVLARRDACSVPLRRGAIALAARTPDPQTTTLLISTARTDPAIEVQAEAIRGLSRVSDATATTALTDIATSSKNPALQRIAVRGLASQDSPAAQQAIRSFMTRADLPTDVRITALHYAGKSDLQIGDLAKMYDTSADRSTRSEIISLLEQRTEPEASDKLIGIARTSTDPAMRRRAIEALTHKKDPRTAKLLMDILGK
jgi:tetratricopeptide (TPR) repeat protein